MLSNSDGIQWRDNLDWVVNQCAIIITRIFDNRNIRLVEVLNYLKTLLLGENADDISSDRTDNTGDVLCALVISLKYRLDGLKNIVRNESGSTVMPHTVDI